MAFPLQTGAYIFGALGIYLLVSRAVANAAANIRRRKYRYDFRHEASIHWYVFHKGSPMCNKQKLSVCGIDLNYGAPALYCRARMLQQAKERSDGRGQTGAAAAGVEGDLDADVTRSACVICLVGWEARVNLPAAWASVFPRFGPEMFASALKNWAQYQ